MTVFSEGERARISAFQADLADGLLAILTACGCKPLPQPPPISPSAVCLAYSNYRFRRLAVRPRAVFWSDTLSARGDLLPAERAAIEAIELKAREGDASSTWMAARGQSAFEIMQRTGHQHLSSVQTYVEQFGNANRRTFGTPFHDSPSSSSAIWPLHLARTPNGTP